MGVGRGVSVTALDSPWYARRHRNSRGQEVAEGQEPECFSFQRQPADTHGPGIPYRSSLGIAMPDLFGNPDRLETAAMKGVAVSLFDATAERLAYESGRNVAQVRTELVHGSFAHAVQTCRVCGVPFFAAPRVDATCNLCRRKAS